MDFWHLINPKLEELVPKDQVMTVLLDLCYIAVDLNASFMYNNIDNYNLKDIGTTS